MKSVKFESPMIGNVLKMSEDAGVKQYCDFIFPPSGNLASDETTFAEFVKGVLAIT